MYIVGWNIPGYATDPEQVTEFDSPHDAHQYLVGEVDRFWDEDTDSEVDEDARWLPVHAALHSHSPGQDFSETTPDGHLHLFIEKVA